MSSLLVILCHPLTGSFNHAVADQVVQTLRQQQHTVHFHDLYQEGFDPVLTEQELRRRFSFDEQVQKHTEQLVKADGLVLVHPDWWDQPPAMLKGWLDRVFRPGVAYEFEGPEFMKKRGTPLLAGKKGLVLATTDSSKADGPHSLETLWVDRVFRFCAIEEAACHVFYDLFDSTHRQRLEWLSHVKRLVEEWFPATPLGS